MVRESVLSGGAYRSAVTTEHGLNVPGVNPYSLFRVSFGDEGSLAMFAFHLNRLFVQADYDRTFLRSGLTNSSPRESMEISPMVAQKD